MSNHLFALEHLIVAIGRILDDEDADAVVAEATRLAETRKVELGDICEGDFVQIHWYLPKREASICGVCKVVKLDEQGLHVEPHSGFGVVSFGDGATDISLMRGIGPLSSRRAAKLVRNAWRIEPFVAPEGGAA